MDIVLHPLSMHMRWPYSTLPGFLNSVPWCSQPSCTFSPMHEYGIHTVCCGQLLPCVVWDIIYIDGITNWVSMSHATASLCVQAFTCAYIVTTILFGMINVQNRAAPLACVQHWRNLTLTKVVKHLVFSYDTRSLSKDNLSERELPSRFQDFSSVSLVPNIYFFCPTFSSKLRIKNTSDSERQVMLL